MKALVLSGGTGTRLRPFTSTTTKQLLPVGNEPILFRIMDMVQQAGIADIGVVVSTEWGEQVRQALGDGARWQAQFSYIPQSAPAGLAHAVKIAQPFLKDSPFLMVLGDNVYKCHIKNFVAEFNKRKADCLLLVKEVADPSSFGIVECNENGEVLCLREKPKQSPSRLACAGVYLFSPAIHEAIRRTKPSWRNELEITDAIQQLIEMGKKVRAHLLDGWWIDTGDKEDLLEANRFVLDEFLKEGIRGHVNAGSCITGKVEVREGTLIENSEIRGPASIAENCVIRRAVVGPYASIGEGSIIEAAAVENSIVLKGSRIVKLKRLTESIIGNRVVLTGDGKSEAGRLFLGDDETQQVR